MTTLQEAVPADLLALDAHDPLAHKRAEFLLPEGLIYLDGNSLGALPAHVPARLAQVAGQQWGEQLIRSWTGGTEEGRDWMTLPDRVAAKIARLIGAQPHQVAVGDSTSVNLFKLLSAALALNPGRRVILTDADNFPTDLYVAQGLNALLDGRYELRRVATNELAAALSDEVAVLLLTQVDYRSGARHDLAAMTRSAQAHGILTVWDLAHSAGAFEVELDAAGADFALGCGYKFLNGGPGAPSFLYVAERHLEAAPVYLSGWMGHADPFEMARDYAPAPGARRFVVGTPSILNLAALDAALEVFEGVDMQQVRAKSLALSRTFIGWMQPLTLRFPLHLLTPLDEDRRGSQVAYRHPQASEVMRRLTLAGVIGDFRTPDILRFGLTPLYLSHAEMWRAVQVIRQVLEAGV
ncbi:kynureninase [Deinococcus sp.]|uniref:kynureninase n=1 Tax=Deinococcus sp. TaxID=47478 RepID=UPI003CC6552F